MGVRDSGCVGGRGNGSDGVPGGGGDEEWSSGIIMEL